MILPIFLASEYLPPLELIMSRLATGAASLPQEELDYFPNLAIDQCMHSERRGFACLDTDQVYSTSFELEVLLHMLSEEREHIVTGADVILSYLETQRGEERVAKSSYARGLKFILDNSSFARSVRLGTLPKVSQDSFYRAKSLLAHMQEEAGASGVARPANEVDYSFAFFEGMTFHPVVLTWAYVMTSIEQRDWQQGPMPAYNDPDITEADYLTGVYLEWATKLHTVIGNIFHGKQGLLEDRARRSEMAMRRMKPARR